MSQPIIKIEHLYKDYPSKNGPMNALSDINLEINSGEIFGIIGLSGAGKSTLVRCINFLEKPTSGTVEINHNSEDNKLEDNNFYIIYFTPDSLFCQDFSEFLCIRISFPAKNNLRWESSIQFSAGKEWKNEKRPTNISLDFGHRGCDRRRLYQR